MFGTRSGHERDTLAVYTWLGWIDDLGNLGRVPKPAFGNDWMIW